MIVHSKVLSELFEMLLTGQDTAVMGSAFFWIEAALVSGFGLFWFYRLTVCLGMYDPLFIIPLMQAFFILFGAVAGGIFFHEFDELPSGRLGMANWAFYCAGFVLVLFGLYLVAPDQEPEASEPRLKSLDGDEPPRFRCKSRGAVALRAKTQPCPAPQHIGAGLGTAAAMSSERQQQCIQGV